MEKTRKQISLKVAWSKMFTALLIGMALLLNVPMVDAQNSLITVTGTVEDSFGAVIGASVVEKGNAGNGTITDVDGKFSLKVKSKATLVISFVGYKTQEIALNGKTNYSIKLEEDSETLDEVVVVGYGVQKKSDVTGSVTSVPKERLDKLPVTNVLQAVQGATAGITITQSSSIPGDAPSALVRGQNSINANSGPYIVVDGVPINKTGGSLNDIAPSDIESMVERCLCNSYLWYEWCEWCNFDYY